MRFAPVRVLLHATLIVVLLGVWIRSYNVCEEFVFERDLMPPKPNPSFRGWYLGSVDGGIFFLCGYKSNAGMVSWIDSSEKTDSNYHLSYRAGSAGGTFLNSVADSFEAITPNWRWLGFRVNSEKDVVSGRWWYYSIVIPHWFLGTLLSVRPILWIRKWRTGGQGFEVKSVTSVT